MDPLIPPHRPHPIIDVYHLATLAKDLRIGPDIIAVAASASSKKKLLYEKVKLQLLLLS